MCSINVSVFCSKSSAHTGEVSGEQCAKEHEDAHVVPAETQGLSGLHHTDNHTPDRPGGHQLGGKSGQKILMVE